MADNVIADAGSGGATFATDADDGQSPSVHYPLTKVVFGALNTFTLVTATVGLPVGDAGGSLTVDNGGTFVVQETGAALTSLQLIDDAVYTDGSGTPSKGLAVMGTDGTNPQIISVSAAGLVNVADGGGSLTVDGTVAATQSGTWTIQPGNTANTTAWLVTGTGGTFPATQSGTWNITNISGTISLPTGAATAVKQPALGTAGTASADVITIQGIASMTAVKVDGSAVTQPVSDGGGSLTVDGTVAATQSGTWNVATLTTITNVVHVDDNSSTLSIDDGAGSITVDNGGTFAVQAAQSGTWTIQPGNTPNTTAWLTSQTPATSGGLSISRTLSAANTTGISVKGSAGQVYGWVITNTNAAARFVKLYNKATAPSVGTDTPVMTLAIPGNTTGTGMVADFPSGIAFGTGIGLGISTGVADNDTGAPSANEIVVNLLYK